MPEVDKAVPVFFVHDAKRSIDWYTCVLGFRLQLDHGGYAGIALEDAQIHLAQRGDGDTSVRYKAGCYLRLKSGIDAYVNGVVATGESLVSPLADQANLKCNASYAGRLRSKRVRTVAS
jgi:catechol 2,3-dioxygenase-like lactoylglutathione lyase family enzyme